ncbi:hypothetical protein EDB92DRAFT_2107027 [Lactarius akahatsu]|uniref:F-box domain-containing protein n=1 Tax=Lactarius akahatsu TaxID=416441 RepID=A0AAD4L8C2_9AGAM|nr:hypothetical protein EDB92DRAFT_2107027 [Lactarius akahatsu]
MSYQRTAPRKAQHIAQNSYLPSIRYWSDAVQRRIDFVDNILQQVPPSTLNDALALRLVNREMSAIFAGPFRMIGSRHNALTRSCRIPPEILSQIFLHYQLSSSSFSFPSQNGRETYPALCSTVLWWVPAVAHVCGHWRIVALGHPRLWSNIALHLGRTWAQRMLTLSKAVPITIAMNDLHPCEASMRPFFWARPPKPGPPKLDPHKVLVEHLFHIRELELGACSCTARRWVSLLEAAAPLLETLLLRVNLHRSGLLPSTPIALPDNFLTTHPRLRRIVLENAFISSWALGSLPLAQLTSLTITALDQRNTMDPTPPVTPTREQLLECLLLMPALQELRFKHCLPHISPTYSPRTVSLSRLHTLTLHDRVDRCYQVLSQLDIPPAARVKVCCWSMHPRSELDCLRILPLLSAHLSRTCSAISTSDDTTSGTGDPHALTLSSAPADHDDRTHFVLSAWRAFTRLTATEDRERYYGPKGDPDVRLECDWDAGDPEVERSALLRACAGIPFAELRALSLRASAAVWSAGDWYKTFVNCPEITHVLAYDALAELVSLTLVGIDFMRGSETALNALFDTMDWRQASPLCVTTLDRIELRACTIEDDKVDCLKEFASVVVWDPNTDADSWLNDPWMILAEEERDDDDEDIEWPPSPAQTVLRRVAEFLKVALFAIVGDTSLPELENSPRFPRHPDATSWVDEILAPARRTSQTNQLNGSVNGRSIQRDAERNTNFNL